LNVDKKLIKNRKSVIIKKKTMAETLDEWYDMLQTTYDKWSQEIDNLRVEFENTEDEDINKKIKTILPTLERYKYYLDYRHNPTPVCEMQVTENE
jgi:hypothetical protein